MRASQVPLMIKNSPPMQETQETWVWYLRQEGPLEEDTATHSSILAWRIPRTEQLDRLESIGCQSQTELKRQHACLSAWSSLTCVSFIYKCILYLVYEKWKKVLVAQSFPTLCDPIDCSLPVSSIHGILQARILDWTAIPFSRGSSWLKDWTQVFCITDILYHPSHQGSPI